MPRASTRPGSWHSASRASCCPNSSPWRPTRRRGVSSSQTMRSSRPTWHARKRGSARRAPTSSTRSQCGGRRRGVDRCLQSGPRATRQRQRDPGCGRAGRLREGAGVDAIFPGSPFEQRFRDMHTLYQQIQARTDHFAVGEKPHTQRKSNGA
jgi:hypothetical protein